MGAQAPLSVNRDEERGMAWVECEAKLREIIIKWFTKSNGRVEKAFTFEELGEINEDFKNWVLIGLTAPTPERAGDAYICNSLPNHAKYRSEYGGEDSSTLWRIEKFQNPHVWEMYVPYTMIAQLGLN